MDTDTLRQEISNFLNFTLPESTVPFETESKVEAQGYTRIRITYEGDEGEQIPAFLLLPDGPGPFPAVLAHHQHHSQRHFGKSEVCGLVGDPLQAFGPALAEKGIAVLAPDSICFEDRRRNATGTELDEGDASQHFNELAYRLLVGDTLIRKVLTDSARALSVMQAHPLVDSQRLGTLGHSYGGNTVLFHAALDERLSFSCSSGAACTYKQKMAIEIGIELAEVIPGFAAHFDIQDLVKCIAPRAVLLVSATEDKYSQDADWIVQSVRGVFEGQDAGFQLAHKRYEGGHALTPERFDDILAWLVKKAQAG